MGIPFLLFGCGTGAGGWPRSLDISKPQMKVPPDPSHSGTGDATDLNQESVRDALSKSSQAAIATGILRPIVGANRVRQDQSVTEAVDVFLDSLLKDGVVGSRNCTTSESTGSCGLLARVSDERARRKDSRHQVSVQFMVRFPLRFEDAFCLGGVHLSFLRPSR